MRGGAAAPSARAVLAVGSGPSQAHRKPIVRQPSIRFRSRKCSSPSASSGRTARRTSCSSGCGTKCPVHWTSRITEYPEEAGYWSVTTADDVHDGQPRLGDLLVGARRRHGADRRGHARSSSCGRCSSAWTRRSTTGSRCCSSAASRRSGSPSTRTRSARSPWDVLDRLEGREACDLVTDVAQPVVSRVIGSFMGIPPEDDAIWARLMNTTLGAGDPDLNPEGVADRDGARRPRDLRALRAADRRAPRATRPTT